MALARGPGAASRPVFGLSLLGVRHQAPCPLLWSRGHRETGHSPREVPVKGFDLGIQIGWSCVSLDGGSNFLSSSLFALMFCFSGKSPPPYLSILFFIFLFF